MRRLGMVLLAILFLFMVFAGPATQKADAVVVSTVVIGAVIAAMAAAGIGLTVSGMTSAQLSDWVSGKLNDWATDIGGTIQDHIDNNLITVTGRGILSIGTAAAQGISDFISWLVQDDGIQDGNNQVIQANTTTLNGYKLGVLPVNFNTGSYYLTSTSTSTVYYYLRYVTNWAGISYYGYWYISPESATVNSHYVEGEFNSYITTNVNTLYNGWYKATARPNFTTGDNIPGFDSSLIHEVSPDTIIGNGGAINQTGSLSYDTDVIYVPTIDNSDKWFLDVGAEPGSTVQTVTDGVIADTIEGSLTVSGEVAEEEPPFEVTGPIGISGLTEVFPFCIPFDIYDLLSCFLAEPQTPIFTVRFVIPGIINQEITIDLTPFNTVAQVVRTLELIGFAIGLALVTRERFLRS